MLPIDEEEETKRRDILQVEYLRNNFKNSKKKKNKKPETFFAKLKKNLYKLIL